MLILHRLKLLGGVVQADGWADSVISWPKDQVTYPRARILMT
jgi:hypothetical protein